MKPKAVLLAALVPAVMGASFGSTFFLLSRIDRGDRETAEMAEMHNLAARYRARLDAENKDSLRDRERVAGILARLEARVDRVDAAPSPAGSPP